MAGNGQFSQDHDVTVYTWPIFCCIYSDLEWILVVYSGCLLLRILEIQGQKLGPSNTQSYTATLQYDNLTIICSKANIKGLFFFSYAITSDLRVTYLSCIKRA